MVAIASGVLIGCQSNHATQGSSSSTTQSSPTAAEVGNTLSISDLPEVSSDPTRKDAGQDGDGFGQTETGLDDPASTETTDSMAVSDSAVSGASHQDEGQRPEQNRPPVEVDDDDDDDDDDD